MSYAAQNLELQARFKAGWGSTTPVAWPNVSFTPSTAAWVRFTILNGEEARLTFGATLNNFRNTGVVVVSIFSPLNIGTADVMAKADAAAAIFRDWCGATVRCRAATIRDVGPEGQGWYQVNVTIPFQRDALL
jgi:hypothetical protein